MPEIKVNEKSEFKYSMESENGDYIIALKINDKVKSKDSNPWFSTLRLSPCKEKTKTHQMHFSKEALKDLMVFITQLAGQESTVLGGVNGTSRTP